MRSILLILVALPILIPFKSQILAKNTNLNEQDSLHDGNDSENAPNSVKLSPPVDGQEAAKKANLESIDKVQKRQVGIIYRDDQPVGILQPFKRSYRFIPVREELLESNEEEVQDNEILHKRDLKTNTANKRNNENANQHQKDNEKFGDKLKNILDDMGLIEDDETGNTKREMNPPNTDKAQLAVNAKEHENRNKRNEHYLNKNELQNKREKSNIVDLNENYDGGGGDDDDDEKRIERQIRNKIKSLKDRVEREIEAMKQQNPEDWKRKKRDIENNLIDRENDNINPVKQADVNLDPLTRRRRNTDDNTIDNGISHEEETGRVKRRIDEEVQDRPQQLSDLSDSDLFGALPRDFDGELSRYKRVKRTVNE